MVTVWQCTVCDELHEDHDDAVECCSVKPEAKSTDAQPSCPVCGIEYDGYRSAADCCLWRDLPAETRWTIADRVADGTTVGRGAGADVMKREPVLTLSAAVQAMAALDELHRVCQAMDLERQGDRPTEDEYQAAMAAAAKSLKSWAPHKKRNVEVSRIPGERNV